MLSVSEVAEIFREQQRIAERRYVVTESALDAAALFENQYRMINGQESLDVPKVERTNWKEEGF